MIKIRDKVITRGPLPILLYTAAHLFYLYANHYPVIPGNALLWEICKIGAVSISSTIVLNLFTKDWIKSNTTILILLAFEFHFSTVHTLLKTTIGSSTWTSYTLLLPTSLILLGLLIFQMIKKPRRKLLHFSVTYCTAILIFSVIQLGIKSTQTPGDIQNTEWKTLKNKRNIILVVFDQYAGNTSLASYFKFDNSDIGSFLKQHGFQEVKTKSLYNSTPFSMASLFDMDSLALQTNISYDRSDQNMAITKINSNRFTDFLRANNYSIKNFSVFPFANSSPLIEYQDLLVTGKDLLRYYNSSSTIWRDLAYHLYTKNWLGFDMADFRSTKIEAHKNIINNIIEAATHKNDRNPYFIYGHIFLPHPPYIYKPDGSLRDISTYHIERDKEKYIDQLRYTNTVIMDLTKQLQPQLNNSIIIFMSDHGYHYFDGPTETGIEFDNILYISGLSTTITDSVYIPNIFPTVLSHLYDTLLPMRRNTSIYLKGNH